MILNKTENRLMMVERQLYSKMLKAKDKWLKAKVKLDGYRIAKQIDINIIQRIVKNDETKGIK